MLLIPVIAAIFTASCQAQLTTSSYSNKDCSGTPSLTATAEIGKCYSDIEVCKTLAKNANETALCTRAVIKDVKSVKYDCSEMTLTLTTYVGSLDCSGKNVSVAGTEYKNGQCVATSPSNYQKITCSKSGVQNKPNPTNDGNHYTLSMMTALVLAITFFA